jgi:hypothetical protein
MMKPIPEASGSDQDLAQRRALMFATLGFNELVRVPAGMEPSFRALHFWLNSWRGIGDIAAGMRRQGYEASRAIYARPIYLRWRRIAKNSSRPRGEVRGVLEQAGCRVTAGTQPAHRKAPGGQGGPLFHVWTRETGEMTTGGRGNMVSRGVSRAKNALHYHPGRPPARASLNEKEATQMEYAMLKTPDGTRIERTEATRSLAKGFLALQAAGGRVPCDASGQPMLWNERRGWHPREGADETRRAGRPLSYFTRRQLFRDLQIRQERLGREIAFERDLLRTASPLAWRAARLFRHGLAPQPGLDAPAYMLVGWRLHRRGRYDPPASL